MSNLVINSAKVEFSATLTLSEVEIRALDAIVGYGPDAFLKVFKEHLGLAYIRDHEAGVRSFFAAIGRDVMPALHDINTARRDMHEAIIKRAKDAKLKRATEES